MNAAGLVCSGLLAVWLSASLAWAGDRVALVIGNSEYEAVGSLDNPRNDALDISVALEGLGFDVLLGRDLTQAAMQTMIRDFADTARDADVALFYYAGHGFQVDGQNYLVPTDAAISVSSDAIAQTVAMTAILQAIHQAPGLKLIFLDACRDNPFGATSRDDQGLAQIGTEADFMFAYATQPGNVAYDGTGRNSFFTKALLHHLYTPGQQLSELMIAVRRDVIAATGGQQIPWENSSLTRQFVFDTSPPDTSGETLFYQVAASMQDSEMMRLYLDSYPEGAHRGEVLAFLDSGTPTRSLEAPGSGPQAMAQAERLWTLAQRSRLRPLLQLYIERYPAGDQVDEAKQLLGLIPDLQDASAGALCERLVTHPRDAIAGTPGVPFERLQQNAIPAIRACSAAVTQRPNMPHYIALLARATAASGDLARAIDLYRTAAKRGDLRAMVSLAQLNENGTGMPRDIPAAMALYQQAARGGSADAMINLAIALFQGTDLPQDTERAVALLEQASEGGSAKATFNLGVLAQDGVIGNPADALEHFRRAARNGEYAGYRAAAILLDEGRGVAPDPAEAANMLLRGAAEDEGAIITELTDHAAQWSKATLAQMQLRLAAAGVYTSDVDGLPGPNFTAALRRWRNGGFDANVLVN